MSASSICFSQARFRLCFVYTPTSAVGVGYSSGALAKKRLAADIFASSSVFRWHVLRQCWCDMVVTYRLMTSWQFCPHSHSTKALPAVTSSDGDAHDRSMYAQINAHWYPRWCHTPRKPAHTVSAGITVTRTTGRVQWLVGNLGLPAGNLRVWVYLLMSGTVISIFIFTFMQNASSSERNCKTLEPSEYVPIEATVKRTPCCFSMIAFTHISNYRVPI